jgi:hypothetical protein
MVNNLQFLRSVTPGNKPVSLQQGQIAFNLVDKLLFVGDGSNTITYQDGTTTAAVNNGLGYFETDLDISTALDAANSYTDQQIAALVDSAPNLLNTLNELAAAIGDDANFVTTITQSVANVQSNLDAEAARATAAEGVLTAALNSEVSRAQSAEGVLAADLATEVARAQAAEATLTADLGAEVARAVAAEGVLTADLASEVARATAAEGVLTSDLAAEAARALAAEGVLTADLSSEAATRAAADSALQGNINSAAATAAAAVSSEQARAQAAESSLSARIADIENGIDLGTF